MNKLQFHKELLNAVLLLTDTDKIKKVGEQIVKYQTLTAEKKIESDAAQKVIDDSNIAIANLKKEQEKLAGLKQFEKDLKATESGLLKKETDLHLLAEAHDKKRAELKIQSDDIAKRLGEVVNREMTLVSAQKVNAVKTVELDTREKEIRNREDAHKKFIASVS